MNLSSTDQDHLLLLLMLGAPLGLLTERTIHLAMYKADGIMHRGDKLSRAISRDSVIFLLTLATSLGALLPPALKYGVDDIVQLLTKARHDFPVLGWALTVVVIMHAVAPFIVGICLLIGRRKRIKRYGFA